MQGQKVKGVKAMRGEVKHLIGESSAGKPYSLGLAAASSYGVFEQCSGLESPAKCPLPILILVNGYFTLPFRATLRVAFAARSSPQSQRIMHVPSCAPLRKTNIATEGGCTIIGLSAVSLISQRFA